MKIISETMRKYILIIFVIAASCYTISKINNIDHQLHEMTSQTKRFCPTHVMCHYSYDPEWDVKISPEIITYINVITQQPFRWLSKGAQAYAFLSQDEEYVIKFFQQQRLRESPFKEHPIAYIFDKAYREKCANKLKHKEEIFTSSKLAFEEIPEESGILYVHLNKTNDVLRGIRISDAGGQTHKIKSDKASFIVQKKAAYILPTITCLMRNGDVDQAKVRLDQVFDLLVSLAKKKIVDGDHALVRNNNMGFIKDRAIYIDTGHIWKDTNLNVKERIQYEFRTRLRPLHDWLKINYPELGEYYRKRTSEIIQSLENETTPSLQEETTVSNS